MTTRAAQIAEQVAVYELDREQVVAISARESRPVLRKLRTSLITAFKQGGGSAQAFKTAQKQIAVLVRDGMLASHVAATAQTYEMIRKIRGIKLDRSPYSSMLDNLQRAANLSGPDLDALRARYEVVAKESSEEAIKAAQEIMGAKAREIAASGIGTKDGVRVLREAMDSAGLGVQKSHLLETVYRTEFQTAYSGARLQADEDPAIQEILWGYEYVTVGDDRVRPTHAALDGTRFEKDDPQWQKLAPPNGWGCRCSFVKIFKDDTALASPNPPPKFVNDGGVKVRVAPDEGFDFFPADIARL